MIGRQEERRTGGREENRVCGQEGMRTGQQGDRWSGGPKDRRTIYWLTLIPIDVHVLHPTVIVLQLIHSAVNVQISP